MALISWLWPSSWFSNSAVAEAQALVQERGEHLQTNSQAIDDVTQLSLEAKTCLDALKRANPKLFETLATSSPTPITEEEMSMMIEMLTRAVIVDPAVLMKELQQDRETTASLEGEVARMRRINDAYDKILESCDRAEDIDRQNIQDLIDLRKMVQPLTLPLTCHTDSTL